MDSCLPSKLLYFYFQYLVATTTIITITCSATRIQPNTQFIKTSCDVTMYPKLCFNTLSPYATSIQNSPINLASSALTVTLKAARSTLDAVSKLSKTSNLAPREASAITDCVENAEDSVDELRQSLAAMKNLEGPEFEMKMNNLMTWVSAALTDEDTCMDGFEGNAMNGKIKNYIVNVAQLTSNALALIKNLSSFQVYSP
ncbi:Plant invertase/pectin methylesterase inhibitor superfamily protein [Forsythia ovata]|uniref:Plant invertase/pectin methylesterase inhibitor superfamily protein n=1 Tax=Forsythia ovata TaxID=205694 RepID=A0ABD1X1Y1_9LAMI